MFVCRWKIVGWCWLILGMAPSAGAQDFAAPNILLIMADDMGYGDVHLLNPQSKIPTPSIDRLGHEGMTFTDGHSPSAVCTPTRYGLLTGRYCWRTRLRSGVLGGYSKPLLEPDRATIASLLAEHGYHTGAIGKWHLGMEMPLLSVDANVQQWAGDPGIDFGDVISDSPIHHGFNYYFGISASLDMAPYVYIRNDRFTMLPNQQQPAMKFPHFVRTGPRSADFHLDQVLERIATEAVEFIDRTAKQKQPFFIYVPLTAPHKPTLPKAEFRGTTGLGEYGDFVAQVDAAVGRILGALDNGAVAQNTMVIYTSDNGSYMYRYDDLERKDHTDDDTIQGYRSTNHRANGLFRGTKADIYEAGHHVPFLVRWPGHVAAGSKCHQTICLTDVLATCAEIVGAELGADMAEDSCSLLPMLRGKDVSRGAPVIHHSAAGMFSIRDGKWKLILGNGSGGRQNPKGKPFEKPYQLYDLSDDIAETKNVADQYPKVVEELTERLEVIRRSGRSVSR